MEISLGELKKELLERTGSIYSDNEAKTIFVWLIEHYFDATSTDLLMDKRIFITTDTFSKYQKAISRLTQGEPVQYVLGYTEFFNCRIEVNREVLIPRPETEVLVDWIVSDVQQMHLSDELRIADLGTGSGCIAIALSSLLRNPISAIDVSPEAIKLAKKNATSNQVNIDLQELDMEHLDNMEGTPDIIVSNPPYVMTTEKEQLETNVIDHEPHIALFADDPLYFYDLMFRYVQKNQKVKYVYLELNHLTADQVAGLFRSIDHEVCHIRKDMRGNKRYLKWYRK